MPDGSSAPLDSTAVLIQRVRDGDKDSLERLIQRHLAPLRRYVSGRLPGWARDLADTDDLVQETLLRTFLKMEAFEVRGGCASLRSQCVGARVPMITASRGPTRLTSAAEPAAGAPGLHLSISLDTSCSHRLS
jgi:hypothetical protein